MEGLDNRFGRDIGTTDLVFDVAPVTPLVNLDRENIDVFKTDKLCDIKFTWIPGALGVANLLVVDPDGKGSIDTFET